MPKQRTNAQNAPALPWLGRSGRSTQSRTIVVDGRERRYLLTAPAHPEGAPLVIALHGSNQTPEVLRRFSGPSFDELAVDPGMVVAYPAGYRKHWNDARSTAGFAARAKGYDDVAFLRALIGELHSDLGIDRSKVYLIGFSNGGQLAIRAAHEEGELFAGIMLISALQPAPENFAPSRDTLSPLPVLIVHGTKDPIVPYEGGAASLFGFRPRGLGISAPATAEYWAARNGWAGGAPTREPLEASGADGTRLVRTDFTADRGAVRLLTVEGGGHAIPGTKQGPRIMGRTSAQTTAVDEFRRFFLSPKTGGA